MTLHLSFPSVYKSRYKSPFLKIKLWALLTEEAWSPRVFLFFFLSLTLFFRLIPWSIEALCIHLSAWASKTWTGRRSVSSLPRETGRVPAASVNRVSPLSWSFISFLCKPRNISLFLSSIFLSATFFLYVSLNHLLMPSHFRYPGSNWGRTLVLQYFGHLMWRADSMAKCLVLGRTEDKRRRTGWERMR